jgi:acetolactate synthase-1/2/3 large subunit
MNGAQALLRTLVASGVETCFMNPGTSEMQFVAALDSTPQLRPVLALFEGVATGAADGYGRMAGKPAATLLHLGPGLGNGIANLHNARRAATPVVNVVGDHATYHKKFDSPLESDIESLARPVSGWYRWCAEADDLPDDARAAVEASLGAPGRVATLVLPADVSWLPVDENRLSEAARTDPVVPGSAAPVARREAPDDARVRAVATALESGEPAALLLGGSTLRRAGLALASAIAARSSAKLLSEGFPARLERGAGVPDIERLAYFGEFAQAQMGSLRHLVLVDAKAPVSAFAYPGKPSDLVPDGCEAHVLAAPEEDALAALEALADAIGAQPGSFSSETPPRPSPPTGALTAASLAEAVGSLLPEGAIVADESITGGIFVPAATAGAPPHDVLFLTGASIGLGLPLATGAAIACPDRPVVSLEADGSAMYTIQALWTQAREGLDVTTVILDNASYGILNIELGRVGAEAGGDIARSMLEIGRPPLDFVALAEGLGVPATRAESADDLVAALGHAFSEPGPHLVHALLR